MNIIKVGLKNTGKCLINFSLGQTERSVDVVFTCPSTLHNSMSYYCVGCCEAFKGNAQVVYLPVVLVLKVKSKGSTGNSIQ